MFLKNTLKNKRGFSLVEIIVAAGLLAAVALGVSGLMSNASKSEKMLSSRFNARQFYDELSETLKENQCAIPELFNESGITFTDLSWTVDTKLNLPSGINGNFFKIKTGDTYDKLEITKFEIGPYFDRVESNFKYIGLDSTDLTKAKMIKAAISLTYIDKTNSKRTPSPLNVPIYLSLDRENNKIVSCNYANKMDMLADFCASVSGEWDAGTSSCELPCPAGSTKIDGRCESEDKAQSQTCGPTSSCGVTDSKHIL